MCDCSNNPLACKSYSHCNCGPGKEDVGPLRLTCIYHEYGGAGGGSGGLSNIYDEKGEQEGLSNLDPAKSKVGKEIVDSQALHPSFVEELAKVAEVSVQKGYEPFNWIKLDSSTRVSTFLQAGQRHLNKAKKGYDTNHEKRLDGSDITITTHHLVYAAYNLLMAAYKIKYLPEHDDRLFKDGELK